MPCICNVCTSPGRMDPASSAARITARCAKPLGAVKPLDRPSWFTAVDASDTRPGGIRSASIASSTKTPIASPRTYPSADASRVLHLPSGESIPAAKNVAVALCATMECAPHAAARSISPFHNSVAAMCVETMEELHAVSTESAGPCMPKTKHRRPAAQLRVFPVAMYGCTGSAAPGPPWFQNGMMCECWYPWSAMPTNAPHPTDPHPLPSRSSPREDSVHSSAARACINISKSWRCCGSINSASV